MVTEPNTEGSPLKPAPPEHEELPPLVAAQNIENIYIEAMHRAAAAACICFGWHLVPPRGPFRSSMFTSNEKRRDCWQTKRWRQRNGAEGIFADRIVVSTIYFTKSTLPRLRRQITHGDCQSIRYCGQETGQVRAIAWPTAQLQSVGRLRADTSCLNLGRRGQSMSWRQMTQPQL